jgi:hypothetical protein
MAFGIFMHMFLEHPWLILQFKNNNDIIVVQNGSKQT